MPRTKDHKRLAKKLIGLSSDALEDAANQFLYGDVETPKTNNGVQYAAPKIKQKGIVCVDCKRPRSPLGGSLCRACYILRAKKKQKATFDADTYQYYLDGGGAEGRDLRISTYGEND